MSVLLLIIGLLLFVGLVVLHEFGHFIMARRNGVEIEEFGIGFPPRAWAKRIRDKKGEYDFSINWLPLGGFVKLRGEHEMDTEKGTFGAASLSAKVKIMLAGVVMNLITAFVLLTFLALVGIPKLIDNQFTVTNDTKVVKHEVLVGYVEPGSPAEKAGLQARDEIGSIGPVNGQQVALESSKNLPEVTKQYAGQQVEISYRHNGEAKVSTTQLRSTGEVEASLKTDSPKGYLGLAPTEYTVQRSTWSAPVVAAGLMKQFTELTYKGLGSAVAGLASGDTKKATEQVSGPVGIFVLIKEGTFLGPEFILMIIAVISLTLALINVLPIPALDGGRLFLILAFRAVRKPLTPKLEEWINGMGFAALMLLFVLITIVDVKRFF
ncbi:MAG: hypothetical protein JWL85_123 [Candidatus Saccharibacteria bacterium]|nr:hypothetical protein [Candidatus Saccharibacteria bacterium]